MTNVKVQCPHCPYETAETYRLIAHVQEKHGK